MASSFIRRIWSSQTCFRPSSFSTPCIVERGSSFRKSVSSSSGASSLESSSGNGSLNSSRRKFCRHFVVILYVNSWERLPLYRTLTGISIFCLANRKSAWFTRIFGGAAGNEGLGMFAFCFDWNYVGSGGGSMGALFTPLSTQLSLYFGTMICT